MKKYFNIETAVSGNDGLKFLESHPEINTVISYMNMPEVNGLEFILKAKERFPLINFYILSAFEITSEIEEALKNKTILRYFMKPYDSTAIRNALIESFNSI
ncbi:MAG: response regulator [Syntrophothermus sp.]